MAVDHADNVSNVLPNEIVEWDDKLAEVEGVEVIPNRGCTPKSMTERLSANVLGLATSTDHVSEYTARHRRKEIELPEYYSTFEKEFGTDEGKMNYIGPVSERFHYTDGEAEFGLDSTLVEAALRALDGGGRYDSGEYVLLDCLPRPCVLRGSEAAILIAPAVQPLDSERDG